MTRIYLDAMGGDNAPKCTAEGAIEALRADSDLRITLGGDAAQLTPLLMDCDDVRERIFDAGMDGYLGKPVELGKLACAVLTAVRGRKNG